jgi:hypothetical protein
MEAFDSTKKGLFELLKDVDSGKIQLPDFQRGWVWDDSRIIGLLASIAKSFPIGAIMLLETGNENIRFKTKLVEGVTNGKDVKPDMLILDGQQRLTSLYQSIVSNRVVTTKNAKGYEIKRWYYVDMQKAIDEEADVEEAIFSVNENKMITENIGRNIKLDLSKEEKEFEELMFPICMADEASSWRMKFEEFWGYDRDKILFWNKFEQKIIKAILGYYIPVIEMKKDNPKEAVCQVFEKVNQGGVSLTVFELLTASFASEDFDLKPDWLKIKEEFKEYKVLGKVSNTDFIQAVTLYSTYQKRLEAEFLKKENLPAVSAKRKEMLNLRLSDYLRFKENIKEGFIKASKIFVENHMFQARDLPYNTQLIPMAAILAKLGNKIDNAGNKNKLIRWLWCGIFGELYGSANETRYALDVVQVVDWIENGGDEPKTIYDANFSPSRLNTLRTRNSAAYKGVYALLMNDNAKDWLSATSINMSTYFQEWVDIHHIFPVAWCERPDNRIPRYDYDCIINKTPLSARTNRIIGGKAPSEYLVKLKNLAEVPDEKFNEAISSHVITPQYLYKDDFYKFFFERKEQILTRIEQAMNKTIHRDSYQEEGIFSEDNEEENE